MSICIVGAGPGLGAAVARRFGREGLPVGLVARDKSRLDALVRDLEAGGVRAAAVSADARRPDELRHALRELAARLGPAEVLCFSPLPDIGLIKPVLETMPEDLSASLELNVVGASAAVGEVLPVMRERGLGTLLFTTGSGALSPNPERAASGVTTTAATVYIEMLHNALAPEGIHVSHTVIFGPLRPGEQHEPADVAENLWRRYVDRDEEITVIR